MSPKMTYFSKVISRSLRRKPIQKHKRFPRNVPKIIPFEKKPNNVQILPNFSFLINISSATPSSHLNIHRPSETEMIKYRKNFQ